jgi:hypothetical protein
MHALASARLTKLSCIPIRCLVAAVTRQRNSRALPQPRAQEFFQDCSFFFLLAGPLATTATETAKHARAQRPVPPIFAVVGVYVEAVLMVSSCL